MRIKDYCENPMKGNWSHAACDSGKALWKRFFALLVDIQIPHSGIGKIAKLWCGAIGQSWTRSAQEGSEVAAIWCLSYGCMEGVGAKSTVPSGQGVWNPEPSLQLAPCWVLCRQAGLMRGTKLPSIRSWWTQQAGLRLTDWDWAARVKSFAVVYTLLLQRNLKFWSPEQSIQQLS